MVIQNHNVVFKRLPVRTGTLDCICIVFVLCYVRQLKCTHLATSHVK